jgi:hypothetical protein
MDPKTANQDPFRFKAHAILSEGVLYPHLTAVSETFPTVAGKPVVATYDQEVGEDQDAFMVRIDGEMRREASRRAVRYADNVLGGSRKAI